MRRFLPAALFLLALATPSLAIDIYATGFESPFVLGNLVGQGGWMTEDGGTTGTVQDLTVSQGSKAVQIDAAGRSTTAWWWKDLSYPVNLATAATIHVEWTMRIMSGGTASSWGVDVYNLDSGPAGIKRITTLVVDTMGTIRVWDGSANMGNGGLLISSVGVDRDTWYTYRMDINYATNRASFSVNGVPIGINVPTSVADTLTLSDVDFYNIDSAASNDKAFYDDFSVSLVSNCGLLGDMNGDGQVNGADIQRYVDCNLGAGGDCSCADMNVDASVNVIDVPGFVSALLAP